MKCSPLKLVFGDQIRRGALRLVSGTLLRGQVSWLASEHRSRFCEFDADDTVIIECDFSGGTVDIDTVILNQHNLPILANVNVELLDVAGVPLASTMTGPTATTGQLPIGTEWLCGIDPFDPLPLNAKPYADTVHIPLTLQSAAALRITISNTSTAKGNLRLGMLFAGQAIQLERNFSYGNNLTPLVHGSVARLASGFAVRDKLNRRAKAWSLALEGMTELDRQRIYQAETSYSNEPVFVAGYPNGAEYQQDQYSFIGLIEQPLAYSHASFQRHSTPLTIIEV